MAVEGGSGSAADSYIGSLISLTSKSEMRYEGVLYNINTEESSIGLQNVRSFGTEGRKKDGPQIPPSEKVYEYILFRGSDIKDLQVKSSPAAQNSSPVNNDPAIIQSQNPHAALASTNLHSVVVSTTADTSLQTSQLGMPESNQNGASLYQPGRSVGSWGPSPPSANGSGIGMPMYWQGYYAPPNGLPSHQYQQPLMRPPGLSMPSLLHQQMPPQMPPSLQQHMPSSLQQKMPSSIQQHMPSSIQQQIPSSLQQHMPSSLQWQSLPQLMPSSLQQQMPSLFQQPLQYPNFSAPLPNGSSSLPAAPSLFPSGTSTGITTSTSISSSSTTFPSSFLPTLTVLPVTSLALDAVSSLIPIKAPIAAIKTPVTSLSPASLLLSSGLDGNALLQPLSSRPITTTSPAPDQNENVPHSVPSNVAAANPMAISTQAPAPALLTPGHLLKSSSISLVPSSQTVHKDVEVVRVSSSSVPEPSASVDLKVKPPTQPLSTPSMPNYKPNAARTQSYHGYKGRGRGRGRMNSSLLTTFSEDFDFTAMNEKFNKDEVWGHLGKSSKSLDQEDEKHGDEEFSQYEEFGLPKIDIMPVYNKDDFFDSLSSNTRDQESNRGRHWFSEQRKIDMETFGEFSRYRGSRGRHGPGRGGGGRYRGSYYGRDFGRGGYGYERIRGRGGPN